jgi:hypothetical protein
LKNFTLTWRETPPRWVPLILKNPAKHACRLTNSAVQLRIQIVLLIGMQLTFHFFPLSDGLITLRLVNWNSLHAPMKPASVTRKAGGRTRTSHWSASETWTSPGSRDWTTRTASFRWC